MTNLSAFRSQRHIATDRFINAARKLAIFQLHHPHHIDFDEISWNLRGHVSESGSPKSANVSFKTLSSTRGKEAEPIPGRLGLAIKAVVAQKLWATRDAPMARGPFQHLADAGKKLHIVLAKDGLSDDPTRTTREHLDACLALAGKSRRHVGAALSQIARVWVEAKVAPELEGWRFQPGPSHSSRLTPQRAERALTDDEIGALAEAFHRATDPIDQVATSVLALLCCAPSRIGEVFALPYDAEVVDRPADGVCDASTPFDEDLRFHFGLRWWPEKGGKPMIKYVPSEMVPVAKLALDRLRSHTHRARQVATWMMAHPGQMPLPDGLEHVRITRTITAEELGRLYNIHRDEVASRLAYRPWKRIDTGVYDFDSVEAHWRSEIPKGWPVFSGTNGITYDRALLVVLGYQLSATNITQEHRVTPFTDSALNAALRGEKGKPGLFERMDIRLPNGSFPDITTHRIRHYLNTIAQRAHVPQAHIAHWSGRKNVMQNHAYDHTNLDALVDDLMRKGTGKTNLLPTIVDDADPAFQAGLARQNITSTPIGFCLGDLRFEPCDKAGACVDCTRLVCVAGDRGKINNLERDLARRQASVSAFEDAIAAGRRVNRRAFDAARNALAHGHALLATLSDPQQQGSLVYNRGVSSLAGFSHADRIVHQSTSLSIPEAHT